MDLFFLPSCLFDYPYYNPFVRDLCPLGSLYVCGLYYCKRHVVSYGVNAPKAIYLL